MGIAGAGEVEQGNDDQERAGIRRRFEDIGPKVQNTGECFAAFWDAARSGVWEVRSVVGKTRVPRRNNPLVSAASSASPRFAVGVEVGFGVAVSCAPLPGSSHVVEPLHVRDPGQQSRERGHGGRREGPADRKRDARHSKAHAIPTCNASPQCRGRSPRIPFARSTSGGRCPGWPGCCRRSRSRSDAHSSDRPRGS
jgi:hypothetical protein